LISVGIASGLLIIPLIVGKVKEIVPNNLMRISQTLWSLTLAVYWQIRRDRECVIG
jgi:hypothetical protein